jgi:hypothetical protein
MLEVIIISQNCGDRSLPVALVTAEAKSAIFARVGSA